MLVLASLLLASSHLIQQPQEPDAASAPLEAIVQDWHDASLFDGVALVAQEGELVMQTAVGAANRSWEVEHRVDAVFPIASLTKQFTAVLVLQAVQEGRFALEDSLADLLPEFPEEVGARVQVQHLLLHAGGFRDPDFAHYLDPRRTDQTDLAIAREFLWTQTPDFEPGTEFRYSNADYHLLGAVLEAQLGQSFAELMEARIAQPLGLRDTRLADRSEVVPRRPTDYVAIDNAWRGSVPFQWSNWQAAGGLQSSLRDLHRWNQALVRHELLDPEMTERMLTVPEQPGAYVALGSWVYARPVPGTDTVLRIAERRGAIGGHAVMNALDPERQAWVILYSNHGQRTLDTLSYASCLPLDLFSAVFEGEVTGPPR